MPTLEEAIGTFEQLSKLCETNGIHDSQELYKQYAAWLRELQERRKRPEVIRCSECKWWTKQKNSGQGRCELLGIYPTGGWYCANGAEERTDG